MPCFVPYHPFQDCRFPLDGFSDTIGKRFNLESEVFPFATAPFLPALEDINLLMSFTIFMDVDELIKFPNIAFRCDGQPNIERFRGTIGRPSYTLKHQHDDVVSTCADISFHGDMYM